MPVDKATNLRPEEWLALTIVGREAAKFREQARPGRGQEVDLLLRIKGTVNVGEDGKTTRMMKPSQEQLLGWVLHRLHDTGHDDAAESIRVGLSDCASNGNGGLPVLEGFHELAKELVRSVSKSSESQRKGRTTGHFEVGIVDQSELSAAAGASLMTHTRRIVLTEE